MTNYQEMFYQGRENLFNKHIVNRGDVISEFDNEFQYILGNKQWEYEEKNSIIRFEINELFKSIRTKMEFDHYYLFKAKIPWDTIDRIYKKSMVKMLKECQEPDFNKTAGYFYENLLAIA